MKSGLEGRNNIMTERKRNVPDPCLNEVRPRRPEQSGRRAQQDPLISLVSMKSGLEGRNNPLRDISRVAAAATSQ